MAVKRAQQLELAAYVDWENIRRRLADNYAEKVDVGAVMEGIGSVALQIGRLKRAVFYGDFTLRREEARAIQSKARFEFRNVLRARSGRDLTDQAMQLDIFEAALEKDLPILICSGDSGYAEVIRKVTVRGHRVYVCAVGVDVSPELTSLAPFYPIEPHLPLELTKKTRTEPFQAGLQPGTLVRWNKLVRLLSSLESSIPFVGLSYLLRTIMPSYHMGGASSDDRYAYLESAREQGLIEIYEIENPTRPGTTMRAVRLDRGNEIVKEVLRQL
jgi:uncharacterized LabA/DUF88 family protein